MRADDLARLDDTFFRSERAFHDCFEDLLSREPANACSVKRSRCKVYLSRGEIERFSRGAAAFDELGRLLHVAGVGPIMASRRAEHAAGAPALPEPFVPDTPWVRQNKSPSTDTPVDQVQACMTLLSLWNPEAPAWARLLARGRLADLLLTHPILLHPRFVWAIPARFYVAVPMLHAIGLVKAAALPAPALGYPASQLRNLALHPVLPHALSATSPVIETDEVRRLVQGRPLLRLLSQLSTGRVLLAQGLLYMDRVRHEEHGPAALFSGTAEGLAAIGALCERSFYDCWHPPSPPEAGQEFLAEFARWPHFNDVDFQSLLLARTPAILVDAMPPNNSQTEVAADVVARYDRFVSLLVASRVFESGKAATAALVERLFSPRDSEDRLGTATFRTTVEVAHALIDRWQHQGIKPGELARMMRGYGDAWDEMATALAKVARMDCHRRRDDG